MAMSKYERLYGCTLEEYAAFHGVDVEAVMSKTKKDIELLRRNYQRYAKRNIYLNDDELDTVREIEKEIRKKLEKLDGWS